MILNLHYTISTEWCQHQFLYTLQKKIILASILEEKTVYTHKVYFAVFKVLPALIYCI